MGHRGMGCRRWFAASIFASLRDQRLDLSLLKEVKQGDQILSKQFRFQPFECLDAVGNDTFSARKKPTADDVQPEDSGSTKALTTTWTTRGQSLPAYRGNEAVAYPPASTECLAGMPQMRATDGVKDGVHPVARETVNLFHEILMFVINWDDPHAGNGRRP